MNNDNVSDTRNFTQNKIALWTFRGVWFGIFLFTLPIFLVAFINSWPPCSDKTTECIQLLSAMKDSRRENVTLLKDLFFSVLPVFSAWIGAVLAFYYGTDSLKTATAEAVRFASGQRPERIDATALMVRVEDLQYMPVTEQTYPTQTVKDILEFIGKKNVNRLPPVLRMPLVTDQKIVKGVADRDLLQTFVEEGADDIEKETRRNTTLSELMKHPWPSNQPSSAPKVVTFADLIEKSMQFIDVQGTTEQISALFAKNPLCRDVFVTQNGGSNEAIVGWISKNRIMRYNPSDELT